MKNMKKTRKNVKYDVNVKIKNTITRFFRISVFDVCFTNFINKAACYLKKIKIISSATKQAQRLKDAYNVTLWCECLKNGTLISNLVSTQQQNMTMNTVSQQVCQRQDQAENLY